MIVNYEEELENSLIEAYIATFAEEPWNETWEYEWVLNRIRWVSSVPNFVGKVAVVDQKVVGALLGYAKPFREKMDFEILELFVLPSLQGQGIGRKLTSALEASLPKEKYGAIHLLTGADTSSEAFYKALGYQRNEKLCFMVHRR